jgi:tetratricopeptide (TPR) repeat protein
MFSRMAEVCFADAADALGQAEAYQRENSFGHAEAAYKAIVTDYPGTNYAVEAQKRLVMLYKHEPSQAEAAFQKLLSDFSGQGLLAESIHEIAEHHRENKSYRQFEAASQFYQYLAEHWPASPYGMRGQSGLALSSIAANNEAAAQAAIDKLFSDYSEYDGIAKAVYDVAHWCNLYWKYEQATQLYQRVIDNWPQVKREMWIHVDLAHSNIVSGNDTAAQADIDELAAKISEEEFVAGALYDIAEHYQRLGRHARAKQVYQYVVDNRPGDYYGVWSQMGVVVSDIHLGNEAGVQVAFDKLIADFSGHEHLSDAVFYISDNYDQKV